MQTNDTAMIDPVCGMKVTPPSSCAHHHAGVDYYFCCQGCQQKFSQDPGYYLSGAAREPQQAVPGAVYICPMDPEIEEDQPGSCPICGMALEPAGAPTLEMRTEFTCPMHPEAVQGDLRGILRARRLSRATMRNIRQNLFFAFVYNSLGVPIAAGLLYPVYGLLLSPMLAAAAMSLSSVSVIGNALRLRKVNI